MDALFNHRYSHESQPLSQVRNQETSTYQPPMPVSDQGFPILAITVMGIMATAFLLISYYIFVTKCCLNWQQFHHLRRFAVFRTRRDEDPLMTYSPSMQSRGLDELLIRELPTFQYHVGDEGEDKSLSKCVVCLNEFRDQDMMRILPRCRHAFHLDCIDIWLQSNANCPLCRSSISGRSRCPPDQIVAPSSSPQDPLPYDSIMGGDEDFVVIELSSREDGSGILSSRQQERSDSNSSRKLSEQKVGKPKPKKFRHASIMGDECIDTREKDDRFSIQPIRRSFSMDSAADRHVYLSVQDIIRQNRQQIEIGSTAGCSNRVRRSLFSFGNGRGSRNAILPLDF